MCHFLSQFWARFLHLLLLAFGSRQGAHPDPHIKDLIPVFPHHKAGHQAHKATDQVQNHLDEQEHLEGARDAGTVSHIPVHEGPAQRLRGRQLALAGVGGVLTGQVREQRVVVGGEGHGQHAHHQPQGAQHEVQQFHRKLDTRPFINLVRDTKHKQAKIGHHADNDPSPIWSGSD